MKKYINIIPFVKNTYKINDSCIFNVFNYILTYLPASNFVVSGETCNTQMEGQKDADTSVYTRIEETDTVQANSDLVSEIRLLPNSEKPSDTHTESNRQTFLEAEHTHVLNTRFHNDNIGVLDNETDSGTDTIQNIEDNVLPEIPGVDNPMHSGNHLSIINIAVYSSKLISYELFMFTNFIGQKLV